MKITILGTGTTYVTTKRSGPAYLLEVDGKKILIDCGSGTLMQLSKAGVNPLDLDYVFLTHFHPDHSTDLFGLQMNFVLNPIFGGNELKKYPVIYGPKGVEGFTKKLGTLYEMPIFESYDKIKYKNLKESQQLGSLMVNAFKVDHVAAGFSANAYALKFEQGGKIFVFSGDSTKCEGLENACKNADLFICDTSYKVGKGSSAHLDTYEIGEMSRENKVKKVVLTHIYPNLENVDLISEVRERYKGEVIIGEDLMEIEV